MSFDCSRFIFNPWHDFLGVVMQQGRVQLDSDWNDFSAQLMRRIHAGTLDTFGEPVVPRVTPDGFRIEANGGALTIGVGRIYVDGLLAENHGAAPLQWDALLAEQTGTGALDYTAQPYFPQPPPLPGGGPHLVYLDVWQREVTHLQYPDLVEKAVGVDTTARLQTAWQVRVHPNVGQALCATPDEDVPGWDSVIAASGARLTTSTGAVADTPNPCLVPPSGGFKGLESQLYRVEIHHGGNRATTNFKWSRDNATVASRVSHINTARDRLVVDSIGRDAVLGFHDGDWIEVTDDIRELHGEPGVMARITQGGGVDDATHTLILDTALPAGLFPTDVQEQTDPVQNTRVRRWDQSGRVLRADGTLYIDLDGSSDGLIPVPPVGTALFLEDGILVNFDLDAGGGDFHVGDYWSFAARTADASVELLDQAPPRGTHHHYARLAIVSFPDTESDCRVLWPPVAEAGEGCACDRCVTPEGHNDGTATLQQAVDALAQSGGVICLTAGMYRLREPLRIDNAGSLRIRGKGWRTLLVTESPGPVMQVSDSLNVAIEHLTAAGAATSTTPQGLIDVRNVSGLELEHLFLQALSPGDSVSAGVSLGGYALGVRLRECAVVADVGIRGGEETQEFLLTTALTLADNLFVCNRIGVRLGRNSLHYGETSIARNLTLFAREAGVLALGSALPGATVSIQGNVLYLTGDAIVAGSDGLRILDNEIAGLAQATGNGIILEPGLDQRGIGHCWITGNRIADMQGTGIVVRTTLGWACIKQNMIERMRHGIVFSEAGAATHLSIENNQLLEIAAGFNPAAESVVAIQLLATRHADIVGNVISAFARNALQAPNMVAIRDVGGGDIRIADNHLSDLGPTQAIRGYAAGIELGAFTRANIDGNIITRMPEGDVAAVAWHAVRIAAPTERGPQVLADASLLTVGRELVLMTARRLRALTLESANSLSVRGNQVMARGCGAPLVLAAGVRSILFNDNHCEAERAANTRIGFAIVELQGAAVIASQNRVRWTNDDFDAINISGTEAFTVLGNITMGNIRINGGSLPAPWNSLNISAS